MSREEDSAALLLSSRAAWEATSTIDVGFEFDLSLPVPDTNRYNLRAAATSAIELWSDFDLDVQFIWTRNNDPETTSGGETPQPDDFRLYLGVGWSF